jgi:hypothetical protein
MWGLLLIDARNVEEVALFPGLKRSQKQFSYAAKQLIAREVRIISIILSIILYSINDD